MQLPYQPLPTLDAWCELRAPQPTLGFPSLSWPVLKCRLYYYSDVVRPTDKQMTGRGMSGHGEATQGSTWVSQETEEAGEKLGQEPLW